MKIFPIYLYIIIFNIFTANQSNAIEIININNLELIELNKKGLPVIDIRTYDEWKETGVIPKSHLLTFFDIDGKHNFNNWITNLDKIISLEDPFILICRSGNRSKIVSEIVLSKNISNTIYNSKEGIIGWIASEQITEKPYNN